MGLNDLKLKIPSIFPRGQVGYDASGGGFERTGVEENFDPMFFLPLFSAAVHHRLGKMALGVVFALSLVLISSDPQISPTSFTNTFTFPEFPYKETTKNELLFKQFEQACEDSGACKTLSQEESSVAKSRCIRECVSPSCYKEIYLFDQLEEGEIDVRLNSFKGCFMHRNSRPRK